MSKFSYPSHRFISATDTTATPAFRRSNDFLFCSSAVAQPNSGEYGCVTDTLHRRIYDTSTMSLTVRIWQTSEVEARILAWGDQNNQDILLLKAVTTWQRKYINYQATYSAYLLGALTEEEFEIESAPYICELKEIAPSNLAPAIGRLKRLLDFELGEGELAEFFEVDACAISQAMLDHEDLVNLELATLDNVWQHRPGIEG